MINDEMIVQCAYCAFMSQFMMAVYMEDPMFLSNFLFETFCLVCVLM